MDEEKSVNVLDSLDGESQDKSQDEGKKSSDLEKKIRENLRAEYERKANEKIEAEKARLTKENDARIKELEGKARLTPNQENELENRRRRAAQIKSMDGFDAWDVIIRDTIREEMGRREQELSKADYDRYLKDHSASQAKATEWFEKKAESLNLNVKEFGEELMPFLASVDPEDHLPEERIKMAFDKWQKFKEKYSGKKEVSSPEFAESGGSRQMRKINPKEAIKTIKDGGSASGLLAAIAAKQSSEEKK